MDLIFKHEESGRTKTIVPLPLLEWKSEIDSFMKSRADLVCPDSVKDLYPLGLSFTKPEHDIKSERASTFRGGEDMGTSESSRRMV
jgi:hypothetical protein